MKGFLHSLPPAKRSRDEFDRYWTPCYVTEALLAREKFEGLILEPACGEGHISKMLVNAGYEVEQADIVYGQDFFDRTEKVPNIVTNPPYGRVNDFIAHALEIATDKIALMCRLHVIVSKGRYAILNPVAGVKIYIFTTPIMQPVEGGKWKRGSAFTHCWLVLDKKKIHREFEWIEIEKHFPLDPPEES